MIKSKILILFVLCSCPLLFYSCIDFSYHDGVTNTFWAMNFKTNRNYQVTAELRVEGRYCNIWTELRSGVTDSQARQMAYVYDTLIYGRMMEAFGVSFNVIIDGETRVLNTMEYSGWLVNGDGKLCILLLNIIDDFEIGVNDSYIAGYFWGGDFLDINRSNRRSMIYIDTNPGMERINEAYSTLAHEMQHLMNFVTSIGKRTENQYINIMDTWIDEGLSSAAEWVFSNEHLQHRIDWFNNNGRDNNMSGLIDQGNNFFIWGNRRNESIYAVLDDYATVYLFFQWLRLQADDNSDIYRKIISSPYSDYRAVTSVMNEIAAGHDYSEWEVLLRTWLAANCINADSGPYGYQNDPQLKEIQIPSASSISPVAALFPGEGVYSFAGTKPDLSGQGVNIRNVFLTETVMNTFQSGSVMLTYNINTNGSGPAETGVTTGVTVSSGKKLIPAGRSINAPVTWTGPWRIDAGDFLRQKEEQ